MVEKLLLQVDGMSCGHCEIAVQEALRKLPGVKKARANRRKKTALVEYEAGAVSPEALRTAVEEVGFQATLPA
ncbi:MAG: cation transporter [Coriobacteriales bacterium]|jgi:copper chaperone CopZ|nr:cation transporter [Coriobacteriales bacterium]